MIRGICSGLRDPDISRGLCRKGNARNAQFPGAGRNRCGPSGTAVGYRHGILLGRIPKSPGCIQHNFIKGLLFLHVDLKPLHGILGLGRVAPTGPMIAVDRVGRRDIV